MTAPTDTSPEAVAQCLSTLAWSERDEAFDLLQALAAERDAALERDAKLREALTAAANQLEKVHSDAFRQSGGQGLCTSDGRAFSCFEINNCDGAARTARAALQDAAK